MSIVLDKIIKSTPSGSFDQKRYIFLLFFQSFFLLEKYVLSPPPKKMANTVDVCEVNFFSKLNLNNFFTTIKISF